jgi:hypothetical protein
MCSHGPGASSNYNTYLYGTSSSSLAYVRATSTAGVITCGNATTGSATTSIRPNFRIGATPIDIYALQNEITSVNATHPFAAGTMVTPGTTEINILRTAIRTRGMLNTGNLTTITFDAKGTTSTHISAARLYFTDDDDTFNATNLVGTITTGPNAAGE